MTDIDLEAAINYVRPVAESATVGMYGAMLTTVLDAAARLREAEAERDKHLAARLNAVDLRAIVSDIATLLDTATDERGITWWEWIEDGLGGSLHDDLRAILSRYKPTTENGSER